LPGSGGRLASPAQSAITLVVGGGCDGARHVDPMSAGCNTPACIMAVVIGGPSGVGVSPPEQPASASVTATLPAVIIRSSLLAVDIGPSSQTGRSVL